MAVKRLAIIGGTGFDSFGDLKTIRERQVDTPFGACSSVLKTVELDGAEATFLLRHGPQHTIPPHRVNYRANIWALREIGATHVVGVAAVGGISRAACPKRIILPDQLVDYTYGRKHTFFEQDLEQVTHIDFTEPFCHELRDTLLWASAEIGLDVLDGATYGVTQGPRLETAAEVKRMASDGCDIVGMTAMPETALASELGLCYATCAFCVNWAAGCEDSRKEIDVAGIQETVRQQIVVVRQLLGACAGRLGS